jgi:hypothetical protein
LRSRGALPWLRARGREREAVALTGCCCWIFELDVIGSGLFMDANLYNLNFFYEKSFLNINFYTSFHTPTILTNLTIF